jgi:hypothetical protein
MQGMIALALNRYGDKVYPQKNPHIIKTKRHCQ